VKDRVDRDEALARLGASLLQRKTGGQGAECPGADVIAGYLDGTLDARERTRCEEHFAACARCQEVLAGFARSETLAPQVRPERSPVGVWSLLRWQWLAPAAAVLAVGVVWAIVRPALERTTPPLAQLSVPPAESQAAESRAAPATGAAAVENEVRLDRDRAAKAQRREETPRSQPVQPAGMQAEMKESRAEPPAPKGKNETPAAPAAVAQNVPAEPAKDLRIDAVQMQKAAEPAKPAAAPMTAERAVIEPPLGAAGGAGATRVMATAEGAQPSVVVASPVPSVAWRIGPAGSIQRSEDGRQTWHKQDSGVTANLLAGSAPSDRVCWIIGQRGTVLRTVNGRTWEIVRPPAAVDLVLVTARDALTATVVAADGRKFSTSDGGRTWQMP
jgi:hypothetical protein